MDWFSWLSRTGLEPSLVYEYSLAFHHNELEEGDIAYFNHEFLQSMDISIAKHRLEILKLARKDKAGKPRPFTRLITATKRCLAKYIGRWVHNEDSALVLVSRPTRWRGAMLKKNKRLVTLKQGRLLLTNGTSKVDAGPPVSVGASPMINKISNKDKLDEDDAYWGVEEIRWDAMFQNLKPT